MHTLDGTSYETSSGSAVAAATPPHSIEAEQAVLGAILLSEQAHYTFVVEESLKSEDFYRGFGS